MNNEIGFYQNYNEDVELAIYKKKIDLDYRNISHKFGTMSRISPEKLENYNQYHLYNKLYKNEEQRKNIQARVQTIDPLTAKYFIDNRGKFFNSSKYKVYNTIKGKHYIMQLGQMPLSSRSKTHTQKTQSCQQTYTLFNQKSKTQNMRSSISRSGQNTCIEIQKACQTQLIEQKELKGIYKNLRIWNLKVAEIKNKEKTINL